MFIIYNKDEGFLCEDGDRIGDGYSFEIDEYTVIFSDLDNAINNCEKGEIVLKIEYKIFNEV